MTTKFDHIKLSRAFRPVALATLKADPQWPAYMTAHGLSGASEELTKPQILAAFEALGLDLQGLHDGFHANPANRPAINAAIDAEIEETLAAGASSAAPLAKADTAGEGGEAGEALTEMFEGRDVSQLIDEALAPASVHMTPHLASIMPGLLRPVFEAASRGPRIVREIETRTVTVDKDGAEIAAIAPVFVPPTVRIVKRVPLHVAFGMNKSAAPSAYRHAFENIQVGVCDYAGAPSVDGDYAWPIEMLCDLAAQDIAGLNGWIFGPAGVGKTVGVEQYAARLGRPFFRIAIERTTEPTELIGQEVPARGGGMVWADGKLTRAFRVPHAVILIDEPTLLRSGTLAVLQTALDNRALYLSTGETVKAAEGVFIVAADNTSGCGDDSGRYVDTAPVNAAFLDRFALKTEVSFLPAKQEAQMLSARCGIHVAAAQIMVDFATTTRTQADGGHITMGVTPRRLLAWGKTVKAGIPSAKAWNAVIVTGAAPEDRQALIQIEATDLRGKHSRIDGIVRGTIDPNAPDIAPAAPQSPVAPLFPDDGEDIANNP